jgi:protein-L-isoaspartate(D-aspartate) O-methyltransferase
MVHLTEHLSNRPLESGALGAARRAMLARLRRYVRDDRVIEAIAAVPREQFLPVDLHEYAYDDTALRIGYGQTISQPLMVALMLQAAEISAGDRALEVGTGSGYQAAVLSRMAEHVTSVERLSALRGDAVRLARGRLPQRARGECTADEPGGGGGAMT